MDTRGPADQDRTGLALVAATVLAGLALALVLLPLLPVDNLVARSLQWRSQLAVVLLLPEGIVLVLVVAWLRLLRALVTRADATPGPVDQVR